MRWLLVLCALIAIPANAASLSRLKSLDQPVKELPQAPRHKKFTAGAWNQLEPVLSAAVKINPKDALARHLEKVAFDPLCQEFFEHDRVDFLE